MENPVRDVTADEVAHYRNNGWVKLERLWKPDVIGELLRRAMSRMGADPLSVSRANPNERTNNEYDWYARWDGCSHHDDWISGVSHSKSVARVASQLMGVAQVRFYFDHIFTKLPVAKKGGPTPWHQDLPHHPLDRQGVLTIWTPLIDCPPEMGAMRFLNGSHRAGLLGRFLNRNDGVSLIDDHPWVLEDYSVSPPLDLRAGDATVHNLTTIHHAPENTTQSPRWVYACQWLPPQARYTGAPNHRTDGLGLKVDMPLDHPRFPVIDPA
ncbi:phytanoyl-CoA dioxygenase family protein [Mesorhizobium sp. LSHC414A00]|uniref:phytanoyl-CoA dioxygenase family protein n=1 Tax=Mesorhizobium sp. LSHC414A00 TaxID=1287287 RepID=UPI0018DC275F|nr:phytanoyl-CoA dioxygenase family protein [Mesorhizobium sp. LSHC414A00]